MQNPLHKAAQEYIINRGWAVIPVNITYRDGRKIPDYHKDYWSAKTDAYGLDDPGLVVEAFGDKYKSIAIATGYKSGITVIDLDVDKKTGRVETPLDTFPETYTVQTKSGGYHLYYQYYTDIKNGVRIGGDMYPGVDCRNDGGNVYAPPTDGYTVIKDIDPTPFPHEMFTNVKGAKKDNKKFQGAKAIKEFQGMEEGSRNQSLFYHAEHMFRVSELKNWKQAEMSVFLMNSIMKRPLPESEVETIIKSAQSYQKDGSVTHNFNLVKNKKGVPEATLENILAIFRNDPDFSDSFRANTFLGKVETLHKGSWETSQTQHEVYTIERLSKKYPFLSKIGRDKVWEAIVTIANENKVNPVADVFRSFVWDKKPRLEKWIPTVYHVPDNPYYREMGKNYLVGMVNRVLNPGCQMDNAIVIDGHQGFGKSRSLRALCDFSDHGLGNLFNETSEKPDNKEFAINLLGTIITEFSEGAVFRHLDRKKIKGFITNRVDKYRPPYDRQSASFPRQCVFAMSTNDAQYLSDDGENRRWWPVIIDRGSHAEANIEWLKENRDQLIAEAVQAVKDKYEYWTFGKEAEKILNELRMNKEESDDLLDFVHDYYMNLTTFQREEGIQASDIHEAAKEEGIEGADLNWARSKIKDYLVGKLYLTETRRIKTEKGKKRKVRLYVPTPKTPDLSEYDEEVTGSSPPSEIDF